jgi:hypothetical protein
MNEELRRELSELLGTFPHPLCESCYDGKGCDFQCKETLYCDGCQYVICKACYLEHNDCNDWGEALN